MGRLAIGTLPFHKKAEVYAYQFGDDKVWTKYDSRTLIDVGCVVCVCHRTYLLGIASTRPIAW